MNGLVNGERQTESQPINEEDASAEDETFANSTSQEGGEVNGEAGTNVAAEIPALTDEQFEELYKKLSKKMEGSGSHNRKDSDLQRQAVFKVLLLRLRSGCSTPNAIRELEKKDPDLLEGYKDQREFQDRVCGLKFRWNGKFFKDFVQTYEAVTGDKIPEQLLINLRPRKKSM